MADDFLNPQEVIKKHLKPASSMTAADFGCGAGGWVIPLARVLNEGKVYAIDLLEEPLSALRSKLRTNKLFNVEIIKADVEKTIVRLLANSVDIVLMTNLLFQVKKKTEVFSEARRVLKPGGKILVVDWNEDMAITHVDYIAPEEVKELAQAAGFVLIDEFDAGGFHYGLIFEKQ